MDRDLSTLPVLGWLILLIALGFLLAIGKFIFLPLAIALLLCSAIQPLIDRLATRRVPWWGTVTLVMLLLVLALFFAGRHLYFSASAFARTIDPEQVRAAAPEDLESALRRVLDDPKRLADVAKSAVPRLTAYLVDAFSVMFAVLNQVGLVLLFMVFVFAEKQAMARKIARASGRHSTQVANVTAEIARDVNRYLSIKTMLGLVTGAACTIALWILGVPYALLFGFIAFVMNYIPNIGGLVATLPPMVAAYADSGSVTTAVLVFVGFTVINIVTGNVLEPKWLGKHLDLSPLVMLVALMFWSALWGFAGMLLAVPLTRAVQLVFANVPALEPVAILMSNGEED